MTCGLPAGEPAAGTAMRRDLGRQLAVLRRNAKLTQLRLAQLTGYSRSAISLAEIGRKNTTDHLWELCDRVLGTGGVLAEGIAQINAVSDAEEQAAIQAACDARHDRVLAALAGALRRGGSQTGEPGPGDPADPAARVQAIAAGLSAAGMTARVHESSPAAVLATLERRGYPRITVLAADGGHVALRWTDTHATSRQIISALTGVLAVITTARNS